MRQFRLRNDVFALVIGILLTLTFSAWMLRLESERAVADFAKHADIRIDALYKAVDDSIAGLKAINRLFATAPQPVTRKQFRDFVRLLRADYPYVQSFVYHRLVTADQRPRYEAAQRLIDPGFSITELRDGQLVPAAPRASYLVDHFIEPFRSNRIVFGYDSWSDPIQAEASRRAIDSGQLAATRLKPLLQRGPADKGFTILVPIYRAGSRHDDALSRRAAFLGDTEAVFIAHEFIAQVLNKAGVQHSSGIHIKIYAATTSIEREKVYEQGKPPDSGMNLHKLLLQVAGLGTLETAHDFELGGQTWQVIITPTEQSMLATYPKTLLVLFIGLVITLVVSTGIRSAQVRENQIAELVRMRTAQLQATADELRLRHQAIEACANAILITSAVGPEYPIEYVNPAFQRITGYSQQEIVGQPFALLLGKEHDQRAAAELRAAMDDGMEGHAVLHCYTKDGTMYWNDIYVAPVRDAGKHIVRFVHAHYDITDIKRYEQELEYRANYDSLTGLANRNLLHDRLNQALRLASNLGQPVWVAFIDLDRFKLINDSLGHAAGDASLKAIAERVRSAVRDVDTVSRFGGDEFVLVLPMYEGEHMGVHLIQKIMDAVARPVAVDREEYVVTCSIGIASYPVDGQDGASLLTCADIAMYRAKKMGRNNFQFFAPSMNERARERLFLEGSLRTALASRQFELNYQPQVDLKSGNVAGTEALLRWRHPSMGMISPARFIGLAEETGLITGIGEWVLRRACMQGKAWQQSGVGVFRMAVNLSALQFSQPDIVQRISGILHETGLAAQWLELEMTESMVMSDVDGAIRKLRELKALGVRLSIDDFGTAYSSLAYLKRFPIDVLKIDQSFVRDIALDTTDAKIVVSIITLAHNLNLQVIAEGVETKQQLAFLQSEGCDEIQGNYFSAAVGAEMLESMLRSRPVWQ